MSHRNKVLRQARRRQGKLKRALSFAQIQSNDDLVTPDSVPVFNHYGKKITLGCASVRITGNQFVGARQPHWTATDNPGKRKKKAAITRFSSKVKPEQAQIRVGTVPSRKVAWIDRKTGERHFGVIPEHGLYVEVGQSGIIPKDGGK